MPDFPLSGRKYEKILRKLTDKLFSNREPMCYNIAYSWMIVPILAQNENG